MAMIQLGNALSVHLIAGVGPAGASWMRMMFGAVFLLLIARPNLRLVRKADVPLLIALGVVTGYMTAAFLAAVERLPLGTAVAIEFLGPLTVAGVMSKRRSALVWPALALVGVVLLAEPWSGSADLVGIGFALLSGVCWGLYIVLTQRVGDRFSGISGLAITIPIAAIATMPVGLPQVVMGDLTWQLILLAAGVSLLAPVISFGLEMLALKRMTPTAFGTLMAIEPGIGVVIGFLVLAQAPVLMQVLGILLVVIAGAAAQRGGRREIDTA
ncbi:EamA family transporter [Leucobacter sp. cx-328]|nr:MULTISPECIES: EamA family transporter [unclassified Leucobacter]MBC9944117.1 EamA family transporter [Leucobacter sp. cx-328]MBC9954769.1 EamA family transporter [Leucobacter sp. cx-42]